MLDYEQIDCGLKTQVGTFNYSLVTQIVDNLLSALRLDIDDLITDGITNKEKHKDTFIENFKNVGVDFIKDITAPLETIYGLMYESRVRNLTKEEQKIVSDVVKDIQDKTKAIFKAKNPEATEEEKQKFSSRFIDYTDIHTQTTFPMCELCDVTPQVAIKELGV